MKWNGTNPNATHANAELPTHARRRQALDDRLRRLGVEDMGPRHPEIHLQQFPDADQLFRHLHPGDDGVLSAGQMGEYLRAKRLDDLGPRRDRVPGARVRRGLARRDVLGPDAEHDSTADMCLEPGTERLGCPDPEVAGVDRQTAVDLDHLGIDEVHRRRTDEPRDEEACRLRIDLHGRAALLKDALVHDEDPVGHRHGLDLIVGDVDDGGTKAAMKLADLGSHRDAQLGVQIGQRFVEQEQLGLAHDRPPHRHALPLAAGQLLGLAVQQVVEPENVGGLPYPGFDLGFGELPDLESEAHVLADAHVRVQGVALEDHGDVAVPGRHVVDERVADVDLPGRDRLEAGDHPERCGLAAAGGPHQHGELLVLDLDRQVVDGLGCAERLDYVLQGHAGHGADFMDWNPC